VDSLLSLQSVCSIEIDRLDYPVHRQNNGEPDRSFGGCNYNDENCEYLAMDVSGREFRESYKIDIRGVENQLDAHQYIHSVFSREDCHNAQGKERGTDYEIMA
jgi:hypothetical protein